MDIESRLQRVAKCAYIAMPEAVADDIAQTCGAAAGEILHLKEALDASDRALQSILRFGEAACVDAGSFYPPGGKKPASKEVWQFPRHLLTDIEAALAKALSGSADPSSGREAHPKIISSAQADDGDTK